MTDDESPLFCDRCTVELTPGKGDFFVIRIEAVADPSPPILDDEDLNRDVQSDYERLLESMRDLSAQEAMDQVYRRVTLYLCQTCYSQWIEDPV